MPVKYEKQKIKLGGKEIEIKKGALSHQLGIPVEKNIPKSLLVKLNRMKIGEETEHRGKKLKITRLLKQRVSLAITLKGMRGEKKGDVSKTRRGRLDYTTKRGDKDYHRKGRDIEKRKEPYSK
jgi:hypothetical protein